MQKQRAREGNVKGGGQKGQEWRKIAAEAELYFLGRDQQTNYKALFLHLLGFRLV